MDLTLIKCVSFSELRVFSYPVFLRIWHDKTFAVTVPFIKPFPIMFFVLFHSTKPTVVPQPRMSDKDLAIRHKITSALAGLNSKEEEEEEQEDSAFSDESADDNSSDEDETVEPKVNIHKYKLFLLLSEKFRQKSPFYSKD